MAIRFLDAVFQDGTDKLRLVADIYRDFYAFHHARDRGFERDATLATHTRDETRPVKKGGGCHRHTSGERKINLG